MIRKILLVCLMLSLILPLGMVPTPIASAVTQSTYYVSPAGSDSNPGTQALPFATIQKARDVVRTVNSNMTGDIIVYLRGGTYPLTSTLTFDGSDSGSNGYRVIYQNYSGETPIISGGKTITGWTLFDAAKNIYRSSAVAGGIETRQLYVNGVRAVRARTTPTQMSGYGFVKTASGYTTTDSNLQNWGNKTDIEVAGVTLWKDMHCGVGSIAGTSITIKQPCWDLSQLQSGVELNIPEYIENAYELLDAEGEWYLDRVADVFYYKPLSGENMAAAAVVAPVLETLVLGNGTLDNPVRNMTFQGITFSHATYLRPNTDDGYPAAQANFLYNPASTFYNLLPTIKTPGNVIFRAAKSITFERNKFLHLGGSGIDLEYGSQDNVFRGNEITDVSANGLQIGDVEIEAHHPTDPRVIVKNNIITNNYVHDVAVEFRGGVGIFVGIADSTQVTHNEISNLPYSGISNGWGWGTYSYYERPVETSGNNDPTPAKDNQFLYNHIHHIMNVALDGGGIYNLDAQPGLIIAGNVIHDKNNEYGNVYLDDGSKYATVVDNLMYSDYTIMNTKGVSHVIQNNYVSAERYFLHQKDSLLYRNYLTANGVPSSILDNVGLETAYQDLLPSPTINFAIGKPATARYLDGSIASMWSGYEANKAIDGDATTYAQSNGAYAWMEDIDLLNTYSLSKVRLYFNTGFATDYDILVSTNGSSWTTVKSITGNTSAGWKEHTFTAANARYVRLKMIKPDGPNQTGVQASLGELGVYGTKTFTATEPVYSAVPAPPMSIAAGRMATGRLPDGSISTMHPGHEADKAVDGDIQTYAQSNVSYAWMEDVDLSEVNSIHKIKIYFNTGFATDFDIQVSIDGSNWTTVSQITGNVSAGWKEYTYTTPVNGRYVRVKAIKPDGAGQTGGQMCIGEIEVYKFSDVAYKKAAVGRLPDGSISTMHPGHEADKGVDGDPLTYAQSNASYAWMYDVDLGTLYTISKVIVDFYKIAVTTNPLVFSGYATSYDVQTSTNNTTWVTVASVSGNAEGGAQFIFNPVSARYVRVKAITPNGPNQPGVQMTIRGVSVFQEDDTALVMSANNESTGANKYNYRVISQSSFTWQAGDVIAYDVNNLTDGAGIGQIDVINTDATRFVSTGWSDQYGIGAPYGDLTGYASKRWFHRELAIPSSMVGKTAQKWLLASENDDASKQVQALYDNIVVKRNGVIVLVIYRNGDPGYNYEDVRSYSEPANVSRYGRGRYFYLS